MIVETRTKAECKNSQIPRLDESILFPTIKRIFLAVSNYHKDKDKEFLILSKRFAITLNS